MESWAINRVGKGDEQAKEMNSPDSRVQCSRVVRLHARSWMTGDLSNKMSWLALYLGKLTLPAVCRRDLRGESRSWEIFLKNCCASSCAQG